jgi:hypothetical protein
LEGNESLLSFAAVTDDPPAGIAAHDHCINSDRPQTSRPSEIELVNPM